MADLMAEWLESMHDVTAGFTVVNAHFDGSREAFIEDGGDPEEIRRIERAFDVG